ncbi:MAG: hypothetical protein KDE51_19700, partial [Anaerolineales bacterium]|nr:hypothetical protein [Anaerolineales bacterium]
MHLEDETRPVQYDPTHKVSYQPPQQAQPPRKRRRGCIGCLLFIFLFLCAIGGGTTAVGAYYYNQLAGELEEGFSRIESVDQRETFQTTRIYDRNGELLWEIFGEGNRTRIPLSQMPPDV